MCIDFKSDIPDQFPGVLQWLIGTHPHVFSEPVVHNAWPGSDRGKYGGSQLRKFLMLYLQEYPTHWGLLDWKAGRGVLPTEIVRFAGRFSFVQPKGQMCSSRRQKASF